MVWRTILLLLLKASGLRLLVHRLALHRLALHLLALHLLTLHRLALNHSRGGLGGMCRGATLLLLLLLGCVGLLLRA